MSSWFLVRLISAEPRWELRPCVVCRQVSTSLEAPGGQACVLLAAVFQGPAECLSVQGFSICEMEERVTLLPRLSQVSETSSCGSWFNMLHLLPASAPCALLLEPLPLVSGYSDSSSFQSQAPVRASSKKPLLPAPGQCLDILQPLLATGCFWLFLWPGGAPAPLRASRCS